MMLFSATRCCFPQENRRKPVFIRSAADTFCWRCVGIQQEIGKVQEKKKGGNIERREGANLKIPIFFLLKGGQRAGCAAAAGEREREREREREESREASAFASR